MRDRNYLELVGKSVSMGDRNYQKLVEESTSMRDRNFLELLRQIMRDILSWNFEWNHFSRF